MKNIPEDIVLQIINYVQLERCKEQRIICASCVDTINQQSCLKAPEPPEINYTIKRLNDLLNVLKSKFLGK